MKNTIILSVRPYKYLNKRCVYFLLGNWKQYNTISIPAMLYGE